MKFYRETITVEKALERMQPYMKKLSTETVPLENSLGRYLAQEIHVSHPLPPFRRAEKDGFALRISDLQSAAWLEVIETIPSGSFPQQPIRQGTAARIMTGAPLPEGADIVVMLERTQTREIDGGTWVSCPYAHESGANITPIGFEAQEGNLLLQQGTKIKSGHIAALATFGYSEIEVYRQPKVAIVSTGSELVDIRAPLTKGKIYDSNSHLLANLVTEAGGFSLLRVALPDDVRMAETMIRRAFDKADLVITSGGVSVGDYDILVDIFAKWEGTLLFNKIAMRPGSPTSVGVWKDQFLFALSGNPSACFVGFKLFVHPVLQKLQGSNQGNTPHMKAILKHDLNNPDSYPCYVRGIYELKDGKVLSKQPELTNLMSHSL